MNKLFKRGVSITTVVPNTEPQIPVKGKLTSTPFNHNNKMVVFVEPEKSEHKKIKRPFLQEIKNILFND